MASLRETLAWSLILLTVILLAETAASSTVGYGHTCDLENRCNKRAFLTCGSDGYCTCSRPDSMVYQEKESEEDIPTYASNPGMCVMKFGEACKYAVDVDPEGKQLYHIHQCTRYSTCDSEGYCQCDQGNYENRNGTCSAYLGHGKYCDDDEQKCSSDNGLVCESNDCVCNEDAVKLPGSESCVGLESRPCVQGNCVPDADCNGQICKCQDGFFVDHYSRCQKKREYDNFCYNDYECGKDGLSGLTLVCRDYMCQCDSKVAVYAEVTRSYSKRGKNRWGQNDQRLDEKVTESGKLCAPKPGAKCVLGLCAPQSKCSFSSAYPAENSFAGTCECDPGSEVSKADGFCAKSFNQQCKLDAPCTFPLVCKNSKCACELDIQEFDSENKLCISKVNGPCKGIQDCGEKMRCDLIPGANYPVAGHCVCDYGYVGGTDNECRANYMRRCSALSDCDPVAGLQCIDGSCKCGTFSRFASRLRKCVGLIGSACELGANSDECVENAECRKPHPKLHGRCECKEGFLETQDYGCTGPRLNVSDETFASLWTTDIFSTTEAETEHITDITEDIGEQDATAESAISNNYV